MIGWERRRRDAAHQRLGPHPILDEIRDRDHQQLVAPGELRQLRHARHRAVIVHDFADDAGGVKPGDACEIDRRFRLPGADENSAVPRLERKRVPGPRKIRRARCGIDRGEDRRRAIGRGDAGAREALGLDRHGECRAEARGILRRHLREVELAQPVFRHRRADEAAPVPGHEVDRGRRDLLCRNREVALVLAILVVDDDDHLAIANGVDSLLDRRKNRLGLLPGAFGRGHLDLPSGPKAFIAVRRSPASGRSPRARTTYFPRISHSMLTAVPSLHD